MLFRDLLKTTVPSRLILALGTFLAGIIALGNNDIKSIAIAAASIALADLASSSLNSVYDVEIDKINRQNRPKTAKKDKSILAFILSLATLSLITATLANYYLVAIVLARLLFEYIYSVLRIKKMFIINHISVGVTYCILPLLAASSISENTLIPIFAYFFVLSVFMTPLKDIDDVAGDKKHNVRTLPVVIGIRKARYVIFTGSILLTLLALLSDADLLLWPSIASITILIILFILSLIAKDNKKQESMLTKISMTSAILIEIIFALAVGGMIV
ncbi:MAG: UbiA family prenyltransferase [archaeon]